MIKWIILAFVIVLLVLKQKTAVSPVSGGLFEKPMLGISGTGDLPTAGAISSIRQVSPLNY